MSNKRKYKKNEESFTFDDKPINREEFFTLEELNNREKPFDEIKNSNNNNEYSSIFKLDNTVRKEESFTFEELDNREELFLFETDEIKESEIQKKKPSKQESEKSLFETFKKFSINIDREIVDPAEQSILEQKLRELVDKGPGYYPGKYAPLYHINEDIAVKMFNERKVELCHFEYDASYLYEYVKSSNNHPCVNGNNCMGMKGWYENDQKETNVKKILIAFKTPSQTVSSTSNCCLLCLRYLFTQIRFLLNLATSPPLEKGVIDIQTVFNISRTNEYVQDCLSYAIDNEAGIAPFVRFDKRDYIWRKNNNGRWYLDQESLRAKDSSTGSSDTCLGVTKKY